MNAYELSDRVKDEFESLGFDFNHIGCHYYHSICKYEKGARFIRISPVCRHNGTDEDVTALVDIHEYTKIINPFQANCKKIFKIKIPKNASDKVIQNRVLKAIESFNN